MITLPDLASLARIERAPVAQFRAGDVDFDTEAAPIVMGTVNLSPDSTYRESIALTTEQAIRKVRTAWAQGAKLVDIGAESTTAKAARIGSQEQIDHLVPVVEACAADGIALSIETYEPDVASAALAAGARVLNMTGAQHQEALLEAAAAHDASVILCYVGGGDVRDITDVPIDQDPMRALTEHFARRIDLARSIGVRSIAIDPGLGFYYGNLTDPAVRVRHQAAVLLHSLELRTLGLPICQALPHAFALFEDEFRTAEGFFATLALLGGVGILRTHEVPRVAAVVRAMHHLEVTPWQSS